MDKKLILGIAGMVLFLSIVVIAPIALDKQRDLTDKEYDIAVEKGIVNSPYQDNFTGDYYYRTLFKEDGSIFVRSNFFKSYTIECDLWNQTSVNSKGELISVTLTSNTPTVPEPYLIECLNMERINLTDDEMGLELDTWDDLFMENLFVVEEARKNKLNDTVIREGTVTHSKGK